MQEDSSHVTEDFYLYTTDDMMAMEHEVQELLYGFIRALKPRVVIETGTYLGNTSALIGVALKENGVGWLDTYDIDPLCTEQAKNKVIDLPVSVLLLDAVEASKEYLDESIDFCLIDGGPNRRIEYEAWYPKVRPGGIMMIHDALKGADTAEWIVDERDINFKHMLILRTPRGVAFLQKYENLDRFTK